MSTHTGISCDLCRKKNFSDRRYKCLICTDYDLCSICYDHKSNLSSKTHSSSHPMQMILTSNDYEHIYFGYKRTQRSTMSLTCPQCNRNGFSVNLLIKHIDQVHSHLKNFVLCPICFARQNKLSVHLHAHTDEKMNFQSKIPIDNFEEANSKTFIRSSEQSLLNKLERDRPSKPDHDHEQRHRFLRSLLTSFLSQKSFDNEKEIYT